MLNYKPIAEDGTSYIIKNEDEIQYNNTGLSFDDFVMQYNKGVFNFSDLFPQTYNDIQNRAKSYGNFINHSEDNNLNLKIKTIICVWKMIILEME